MSFAGVESRSRRPRYAEGKAIAPMTSRGITATLALIGVLAIAGGAMAQVKKGKTRPLTTKQLMAGSVGPHYTALGKALQAEGPADDKAWADAQTAAALLNESTYTLMEDGRCPDATRPTASPSRRRTALTPWKAGP